MKHRCIGLLALAAVITFPAGAQQYVYPAKGQSAQQQATPEARQLQPRPRDGSRDNRRAKERQLMPRS